MSFPLLLVDADDVHLARLSRTGEWAVNWPQTTIVAQLPFDGFINVVVGLCGILVAARDNFVETPWDQSTGWDTESPGTGLTIGTMRMSGPAEFTGERRRVFARNNLDRTWSVHWPLVLQEFHTPSHLLARGFCQVLLAARDNFVEVPWEPVPVRPLFD